MEAIIRDKQGRHFKSLRLSVLPYCNFACVYCTESERNTIIPTDLMQPKAFLNLISKINPYLNLHSVRITGGEPTLYKPLAELIYRLKEYGIPKVHLTTNGALLPKLVPELKQAGLDSINVSLDAIDPLIFYQLSRKDHLDRTLAGISAANDAGLFVKLNCNVLKGLNDSQIVPLLDFASQNGLIIRYLELMEMGPLYGKDHKKHLLPAREILRKIEASYSLKELPRKRSATARYWKTGQGHHFGIIGNYSMPFCSDCNRLRMDHTGKIYGCLSNSFGSSISDSTNLQEVLALELNKKQNLRFQGSPLSMKAIGG